jgi:hypothetical protein
MAIAEPHSRAVRLELHVSRDCGNKRNTVLIILLFLLIIGGLGALAATLCSL